MVHEQIFLATNNRAKLNVCTAKSTLMVNNIRIKYKYKKIKHASTA